MTMMKTALPAEKVVRKVVVVKEGKVPKKAAGPRAVNVPTRNDVRRAKAGVTQTMRLSTQTDLNSNTS